MLGRCFGEEIDVEELCIVFLWGIVFNPGSKEKRVDSGELFTFSKLLENANLMEAIVGVPFVEGDERIEAKTCDDFIDDPGFVVACVVEQVTCSPEFSVIIADAEVIEGIKQP